MYYHITRDEAKELISISFQAGFQKCLENLGKGSKYITQNRAYKRFERRHVENWVNDGLLTAKPNGNGKTSTKFYELARLLELDASDKITIRKPYPSTAPDPPAPQGAQSPENPKNPKTQ
jgi:hypothetical protein